MQKKITINLNRLLCEMLIVISLFSGQASVLFNVNGGFVFTIIYYSKYLFTICLTIFAFSKKKRKVRDKEIKSFMEMYLPLFLLMLLIEIIAWLTSPVVATYGFRYWTRSISTFLDRICIFLSVISMWILCGKNAINCVINALLFDEFLILLSAIPKVGFAGIFQSFLGAFDIAGGSSNYFEVHELTFCIGLCLLYYLFFVQKKDKKKRTVLLLLFWFILGSKRIAFLGLLVSGIFVFFAKRMRLSLHNITFIGIIGVAVCLAYLLFVYNDELFRVLGSHNVNNMGRDIIYGYFTRRTKLDISQLGWGVAGVAKAMENMNIYEVYYMIDVRGLHNDILKIFINYGFIGSIIWYYLNLIHIPRSFYKKFGMKYAVLYLALTVYMFVTYLTDNTESYYVCQIIFILIPLVQYEKNKERYSMINEKQFN